MISNVEKQLAEFKPELMQDSPTSVSFISQIWEFLEGILSSVNAEALRLEDRQAIYDAIERWYDNDIRKRKWTERPILEALAEDILWRILRPQIRAFLVLG